MVNSQSSPENRRGPLLAGGLIALAAFAVYANSFSVPFLFDDAPSTVDNPTIRHLWPLWAALSPPHHHQGLTVEGRPILNLSLAINYAISGNSVWSYHALNLLIHVLAGLTLFGIVRRTLPRWSALSPTRLATPFADKRVGDNALHLAFAVALLWTVHPLQTESVTYVIQRAESLMGLFYLLTLYCFIRGVDAGDVGTDFARCTRASTGKKAARRASLGWFGLAWLGCFFGMATKEVMVSAPVMVLLYDRTFVADSFREAWQRRRWLYRALASTWLAIISLALSTGNRGGTAGFAINIKPWTYAITQFQAIAHYLWLAFWPHPLIFDYGTHWVERASEVVPYALVIGTLAAITVIGLRRRSPLGFLGAWIFAILAPTSSIIPGNRQTLAEHRMYLPLAAVITAAICGGDALIKRARGQSAGLDMIPRSSAPWLIALLGLAAGLGALTVRRTQVYQSPLSLFRDTAAKRPDNPFAHYNLGKALDESGSPVKAIEQYREAIRLDPDSSQTYDNLGKTLADLGRLPEAAEEFQAALRLNPNDPTAHANLGNALLQMGRKNEALDQFNDVVLLRPGDVGARANLGGILLELGRIPEAIGQFYAALRINPNLPDTHDRLGNAYLLQHRAAAAIDQYEQALRLNPNLADAKANLAIARRHVAEP